MPAFESNRSTCLIACLLNRPRAAANPWPMVETANDALVIIPCVAFASEYTRFTCRSSPTRLIIKLWMSLRLISGNRPSSPPSFIGWGQTPIPGRFFQSSYAKMHMPSAFPILFGIIHVPFDSFISQNEGNAELLDQLMRIHERVGRKAYNPSEYYKSLIHEGAAIPAEKLTHDETFAQL